MTELLRRLAGRGVGRGRGVFPDPCLLRVVEAAARSISWLDRDGGGGLRVSGSGKTPRPRPTPARRVVAAAQSFKRKRRRKAGAGWRGLALRRRGGQSRHVGGDGE